MSRRILYLDAHRLSAWRWEGGQIVAEGAFDYSTDDLTRFADYLQQHRGQLFTLLANSLEEGYQQDTIPFLRANDRAAVIGRRLGQYFFTTPFTAAIPLGYEKDKRRNEKFLFTALTNPGQIESWLAPLAQAAMPLRGLYSIAQLGGPLLSRLGHPPERCVLLTVQDNTVRESFIVNGVTIFSRVAPLGDSSLAGIAGAFAAEAGKLQQYLLGQRLIGRNEALTAFVLAHPLALNALRNSCIDSGSLRFEFIDNHQAARKIGLKTFPTDSRSELLFLQQLASQAPRQQYLSEDFRHDYRLLLLKRTLLAITGLSLVGALLFTGYQFVSGQQFRGEAESLIQQEADAQRRYQEITATFPRTQIGSDALRQVISRYGELQSQQGGPARFYRHLAQALNASPAVEIDSIEWKQGDNKASREEVVNLVGDIRLGQRAAPRQIMASFEGFVQQLGKSAEFSVSVVRSPFDIESSQALKSNARDEEPLQQHPFNLRLLRKVQP